MGNETATINTATAIQLKVLNLNEKSFKIRLTVGSIAKYYKKKYKHFFDLSGTSEIITEITTILKKWNI